MKMLTFCAVAVLSLSAMSFTQVQTNKSVAGYNATTGVSVQWKEDVIDLGSIPQNKPVTVSFELTNTGNAALVIGNVATSCGCTGATFEKEPIKAGEKSTVSVTYNAAALGSFSKNITVTYANNESKVLLIKGTVVAP